MKSPKRRDQMSVDSEGFRKMMGLDGTAKPAKYFSKRHELLLMNGISRYFDSIAEAKRARELDLMMGAGTIFLWLPQVPIPLPGGKFYKADFMVWDKDGVRFEDVKGKDTAQSKLKRDQVRDLWGIEVLVLHTGKRRKK